MAVGATVASIMLLLMVACGSSNGLTPAGPESAATAQSTLTPQSTQGSEETPSANASPGERPREIGDYTDVTFIVSEGSKATFTVGEQLVRLPLPSDAVMHTTGLSGEVYLDGRPSVIQIDLHQLSSDQRFRDAYVRRAMFPNSPIATFTVPDIVPIPDGLAKGDEVTGQVSGLLDIRGVTVPIVFDIEARDDGDVMFVLGRTSFTWDELGIPTPTSIAVASVDDEVRVEVLLAVRSSG